MTQAQDTSGYYGKNKTTNSDYDAGSAANVSWLSGAGGGGQSVNNKRYSMERQVLKNSDMNQYKQGVTFADQMAN